MSACRFLLLGLLQTLSGTGVGVAAVWADAAKLKAMLEEMRGTMNRGKVSRKKGLVGIVGALLSSYRQR